MWELWNQVGSDLPERTKGQRVKNIDANKPIGKVAMVSVFTIKMCLLNYNNILI